MIEKRERTDRAAARSPASRTKRTIAWSSRRSPEMIGRRPGVQRPPPRGGGRRVVATDDDGARLEEEEKNRNQWQGRPGPC